MAEELQLKKTFALLDIFRFTVCRDEIPKIQDIIKTSPIQQSQSSVARPSPSFNLQCLNLSSKLADKKIIDTCDTQPWDKLQQILFERLMIEDYSTCQQPSLTVPVQSNLFLANPHDSTSSFVANDAQILRYLYGCYYRVQLMSRNVKAVIANGSSGTDMTQISSLLDQAEALILDQVCLYLMEPDLFPDREKRVRNNLQAPMLLNLVNNYIARGEPYHIEILPKFVYSIGETCSTLGDSAFEAIVAPTYARLSQKFFKMTIDDPSLIEWLSTVKIFLNHPQIAKKFLEKITLKKDNSFAYQSTLLGYILSVSHLPRTGQVELLFFSSRASDGDRKSTETMLGIKTQNLGQELRNIFHSLLKTPQTRPMFLSWLGRCLHTFKDRKKLWSNQVLMSTTMISVNDGFLMNILTALLHLSEPFAGPYRLDSINSITHLGIFDKKLLKIDPRYCKWSKATHENSPAHFLGLSEETFLINSPNNDSNQVVTPDVIGSDQICEPNFITECFFGTHQAFSYGFRSVYERFFKLAQNMSELQQAYQDAVNDPMPTPIRGGQDLRELLKEKIDIVMSQFFNLKAALTVPNRVTMQVHFCVATAAYLNHLVSCESFEEASSAQELKVITMEALKSKKINKTCLQYIPEMFIENLLDFFLFLFFFNDQALAQSKGILDPLMSMIITFMSNSCLMQNPHLRARFAEILEYLMPHQTQYGRTVTGFPELFDSHPLAAELAPALLNVFVSIEMTGEGVQFEQKFSYRKPMYVVLEYLWAMDMHRKMLIQLAEEAERDIESARPPLFLRFINLLMNDAIFLLDEALGYMNQLREAERRRKTAEWQTLSPQQRAQAESSYSHIGRLARFHNVLSVSTIGTLAWLSSEIKTIFSHPALVDRMANMLNYFLDHLVGSKRHKFNVEVKNDYEFKPKDVLKNICQIYINLGSPSNKKFNEFCTAVSSDGRSYSDTLLPQATEILYKTGMSALGSDFEKLSGLVHKIAVQNQIDEISNDDIPDTFLDPIMSTLMVDPVLLPSSKIVVDRSTIARHLLSDQTDPFNRSPLSMEDVIPETDLKRMIQLFLKERREAMLQSQSKPMDTDQGSDKTELS